MWHPSASLPAHVHRSPQWSAEDAAAARQRREYQRLREHIDAAQGRLHADEAPIRRTALDRDASKSARQPGRATALMHYVAASSTGAVVSAVPAADADPFRQRADVSRGAASDRHHEQTSRQEHVRAARTQRGTAASRPGTSPFEHGASFALGQSPRALKSAPSASPFGGFPSSPPSSALPQSAAAHHRATSSHHFPGPSAPDTRARTSHGPRSAHAIHSAPPVGHSLAPGATLSETAAFTRRLRTAQRKDVYERRWMQKVAQVLGTSEESVVTRGWEAAEAALRLAWEKASTKFVMPQPFDPQQEEEKQIAQAELYFAMSLQPSEEHASSHAPSTALTARPGTSSGAFRSVTRFSVPRVPDTARPQTSGSARPGVVTVRGATLQTQKQLFKQDLRGIQHPHGATHAATAGDRRIHSADVRPPRAPATVAPAPPSLHAVSPLTSARHWSNRIYTHGVTGATEIPTALVPQRDQDTRASTAAQARVQAQKFASFKQMTREAVNDPSIIAAEIAPAVSDGDAAQPLPTSHATLPPSHLPRLGANVSDAESAALFSQHLESSFSELVNEARLQAHSLQFHSGIVREKIDLMQTEVARVAAVPGLHDRIASLKAEWVQQQERREKTLKREQQRTLQSHWLTGEIVPDKPAEEEHKSQEVDPSDPLQQQKQRHLDFFLAASARDAAELQNARLFAEAADPSKQAATAAAVEAAAAVAAIAVELDYVKGVRVRPEDAAAAAAAAATKAGSLDAALERAVHTEAYLQQSLADASRVDKAQRIKNEHASTQQRAAAEKDAARRKREDARLQRQQRRAQDLEVESSSGDSDLDEGVDEDAQPASSHVHPPPKSPRRLAAQHAQEAAAALEPITATLWKHAVHARATETLDNTAAIMRRQVQQAERAEAERLAQRAHQRDVDAEEQRRKDMAALLRLENNQRAIAATQRNMQRKGTLHFSLLGLVHSVNSPSLNDSAKQSSILELIPSGYLGRFEVRLVYATPDLPQLVMHTLPFSATPESRQSGVTELLQRVTLPILNAHVQKIVVTLQALSPRQLLNWMFTNRHALFGPAGGLDDASANDDASIRLLNQGATEAQLDGHKSLKPSLDDYLKWCDDELSSASARSPQSWSPSQIHRLSEGTAQLRLMPPSASASPRASKRLVPHVAAEQSATSTSLVPRGKGAGARGGTSFREPAVDMMTAYEQSLAVWFAQGALLARPTKLEDAAQPTPGPSLSQQARTIHAHVTAAHDLETQSGWLAALRARRTAARERARNPLAANEVADVAEAESESGGRAGQRVKLMSGWSQEQVSMWLSAIGLSDVRVLLQRKSLDGAALLAAAPVVARIAQRVEANEERRRDRADGVLSDNEESDKSEEDDEEHALHLGRQQRNTNAIHLTRCLSLLTHATKVPLSAGFTLNDMRALRARVIAAFHRVSSLPEYVAAQIARQDEDDAAATTALLSPEETAQLDERLTRHNNKLAAERQHNKQAAAAVPAVSTVSKRGSGTKLLLRSQLQVMESMHARAIAEYRARRVSAFNQAAGPVRSHGQHVTFRESPIRTSAASTSVAMFPPEPPTQTEGPSRAVLATAAAAAAPRVQPSNDETLLLGCFELPIRTVAQAPDGLLRTAMPLHACCVDDGTNGARPKTAGSTAAALALESTPRPATSGTGASSSRPQHFRSDLTSALHSSSPRTFLIASSVSTSSRTQVHAKTSARGHGSPSMGRPSSGADRLPRGVRDALSVDAAQFARNCLIGARVDIEARFVPAHADSSV